MDKDLNSSMPTISVVMAVYNGEQYLQQAIESILNQTYTNFEFIIINDGSKDKSLSIIESFNDKRIILIDNDFNKGLIYSLNLGLKIARGNYVARMDADDISLPDRFKWQVNEFLKNPNAMIVSSDYYLLNNRKLSYIKTSNDSDYQKTLLLFTPCFCHPTVMIKNMFVKNNIFYDENYKYAEDYKMWTDLYGLGSFNNINKPLLKYRHHAFQISNKNNEQQLAISKNIRKQYLQNIHFNLSETQFLVLNHVGNNLFITSVELLNDIENCLTELIHQNNLNQTFNDSSFKSCIHKRWLDSCGNTSLGFISFQKYFNSHLASYSKLSFIEKVKFGIKCIVRFFKKSY